MDKIPPQRPLQPTDLEGYFSHIRADYAAWAGHCGISLPFGRLEAVEGSKYLKVIRRDSQTMVHSFIVRKDTGRFRRGDILKAATWNAPATNFVRGNILCGDFSRVSWTGADKAGK